MTCSSSPKDVFDYLIAITPICVAVFVALIAFWQSRINSNKLRLDIYNRRFNVYSKTLDFYQVLLSYDPNVVSKELLNTLQKDFIKAFRESRFLFDEKSGVYDILDQMHTKSFQIIGCKDHGGKLADIDPQEFEKMHKQSMEALKCFTESISKLEKAMARYLNFHELTE
ncbi:MAG: hypothetical protein FD159_2560 [Syntrophaceae bacterium]|nr:MAG: hypothetical protein FD159_2560 [Syntrophaceae bacterium]